MVGLEVLVLYPYLLQAPQKVDKMIKNGRKNRLQTIVVREFEPKDKAEVHQIFYEGLMEMVPDTAFRGLKHHPESLLLYTAMTGKKLNYTFLLLLLQLGNLCKVVIARDCSKTVNIPIRAGSGS